MGLVAQVVGELAAEGRLDHRLGQLGEQTAGTDQVDAVLAGPGVQLLGNGFFIEVFSTGRHQGICRRVDDVGIYVVLTIGTGHDRSSPVRAWWPTDPWDQAVTQNF